MNTVVATAAAILGWIFGEWALRGKPSLLGACSGAIAGLVGVTPACGYIGVGGALIIGVVAGLAGLWGVTMLKRLLRVDDPCDVFGVHGVCGIVGCIMTGIFAASSLGGVGFAEGVTMGHQLLVQLESIAITIVWSGVVAFIGYKLADLTVGLRVPEEQEREKGWMSTVTARMPITRNKHCKNSRTVFTSGYFFNCDYASPLPERSRQPVRRPGYKTHRAQSHVRWTPRCSPRYTAAIHSN